MGRATGCAIVLLAAMSSPHQLGGIMCLSGWLPLAYKIKNGKHPVRRCAFRCFRSCMVALTTAILDAKRAGARTSRLLGPRARRQHHPVR